MLQQYTLLLIYLSVATAKTITGVFNSFNSLTWSNAATYNYKGPGTPTWNAVLGWSLDGTSASPGDTFTLNMPCVFKFTTSQTSVDLTAHGVKYATCQFQAGEEFMTFSTLTCTVSNTLTPSIKALGTVTLPLAFNVGGTGSSVDLEDSKCFTAGTNTVTFNDGGKKISINVDFERSNVDPKGYLTDSRVIPSLNKVSTLFVAPQCANGYTSGTMGFANTYGDVQIDCSNIHVGITKGLNDWNYPVSSESFSYTKTCSSNGIFITYKNVPAGYRPFVDAYISATDVNSYTLSYANEYTCAGGYWQRAPFTLRWTGYRNSDAGSNGIVIVATTRTVTDSTTAVTTLPFDPNRDKTKTIEILKPIPTTTITTSYVGVTTSYLTKTAPIGETATVIVDIPYHTTTTVTSKWTGTITSTTTHTNPTDSIDTVIVQVPLPNPTVTTTEYWSQSFATTTTITGPPGNTDTVLIREPPNHTVTTTEYWSQSYTTTTTVIAPPGGTDSVIIREPPNPTITTTEYWSQSYATTTTITAPPGETDTVLIREPPNHTVTTTEYWSQSYATTTTIIAPPGETDTVLIREPPNPTVTTTEYWSQSYTTATTVTAPPGGTDTVIIYDTMSSSEISSFSRPHYTNHTTLWSTTWVIETKTITETSCEGDKGCSWVSVSTRIVTIPNNIETPMVTNTVDTTTTESTLQSPSGIFSESGVSVETESSTVTTAQTNPSVPTTESEVVFTTKGNNGNGPYESPSTNVKSSMDENSEFTTSTAASTSTDIENETIATTGSVEASSPIISSSADETTTVTTTAESTSVIEQQTNNNGGGNAPSATSTSSPSTTTTANSDSVITSTTSTNQSQSQSNSDTQQTTLSQQMTSSLVSLHMLTTFDGSGSVIQHSTWLCGLITLLSLFI